MTTLATYLSGSLGADYTATELTIVPQSTLVEKIEWPQNIQETDDKSEQILTLSDNPVLYVTLQWDVITNTEAETIRDFWADSSKAKGRARSFYWSHPTDENSYTVKFRSAPDKVYSNQKATYRGISQIKLKVLGTKP